MRAEGFNNDLPAAHQVVHLQGHGLLSAAHQNHRQRQGLPLQLRMVIAVQQAAQILEPVFLAGVFVHRRVRLVVFLKLVGADPDNTLDGVQRDRVEILAGGHHQRPVDGNRERQANRKGGSAANGGIDVEAAAKLFDLAGNDVHAHAAAGNLGHLLGGGEAGLQDKLQDFPLGQILVFPQHALTDRLVANDRRGNAGAIVDHPQDNVATFAGQ